MQSDPVARSGESTPAAPREHVFAGGMLTVAVDGNGQLASFTTHDRWRPASGERYVIRVDLRTVWTRRLGRSRLFVETDGSERVVAVHVR